MIDLSIVIPTFQRCDSLQRVLLACAHQSLLPQRYEVVVSIDGSTDDTIAMLRQLDLPYSMRWITGSHEGPGTARNRGAAVAQGEVILFLDDDIILTPDALAEHLAGHEAGGKRVCLGQIQVWSKRPLSHWEQYLNQRYDEHYEKMNKPGYQPDFWDCLSGNMSFPYVLWSLSQGFDPAFAASKHDDVELGYRLSKQGVTFNYRPQALGYHYFVKSLDAGLHDAVTNGMSAARLIRFHPALTPAPTEMVWQHYPVFIRVFLRYITNSQERQRRLTVRSRVWLYRIAEKPYPFVLKRPFFQLAYHLHFWQGVSSEAAPDQSRFKQES